MAERKSTSRFDALMPALIGLAGVLIGALITAGITYLGDRARRTGDERTAKRLIASEIYTDSRTLIYVAAWGKLHGHPQPRSLAWDTQAATLARYVNEPTWSAVAKFYAVLGEVEHSLTKNCLQDRDARSEIRTAATLGNTAYLTLTNQPIPNNPEAHKTYGCSLPKAG